jgi:hypothetical protein
MKQPGVGPGMAILAFLAVFLLAAGVASPGAPATARQGAAPAGRIAGGAPTGAMTVGVPATGGGGITETVTTIMERARARGLGFRPITFNAEEPHRRPFMPPDDPTAPAVSSWPPPSQGFAAAASPLSPQIAGVNFRAVSTAAGESPWIPPDSMGDVGPTQILVHVNGRIKVFDKSGALGALNADDTTFWDSVRDAQETTDPEVRYDRLSGRWFLLIVNFAPTNNLVLLAVSSGPTVTDASSFTFFSFPVGIGGTAESANFCDYPGLGVDANALYIGCNMFGAGAFQHTTGYVVRKSSVLGGGPIVVTPFLDLSGGVTAGPWSPRGVDNDDPQATEGYIMGVDINSFSRLVFRRVTNPGGTPAISGNINLTVPTTSFPLLQPASGSTTSLDTADDRLFMASIHKNKISGASTLWTAQNIAVTTACVGASAGGGRRNGSRWYEIGSLTATPALVQSGTLCDSAATNPRGYIYPTVAGTGQGHMALASTTAAANQFAGVAAAGRLRTDPAGSTQAPTFVQNGLASYTVTTPPPNPLNRWGDYSFTDVDPNDDQTVWTVQEYADSPMNNWAVRVIQLLAPPPATPASAAPSAVCSGLPSVSVAITGTSASGSGFFDPGSDPGGPGFANRIAASVSGGVTVTGVSFTDPTHVTLTLDTTAASTGAKNVTITNPDGQAAVGGGILTVNQGAARPAASNNGPVCAGGTLQLTASTVPGATYSWTGPNGFVSSQQNPTISGASTAAAGTYSVTATIGACASPAGTTAVAIIPNLGACNDGNACTSGEACSGGACTGGTVLTPAEMNQSVELSDSGSATTISWSDPPGDYSVYRGTRSVLSSWSYNQVCLAPRISASSTMDAGAPPDLAMYFYLVTRINACGESIPGRDSTGAAQPNPAPCP